MKICVFCGQELPDDVIWCERCKEYKGVENVPEKNRAKFVLLQGIKEYNRFFTPNTGEDPTKGENGEVWYRIIGYADSVEEAQNKLYGSRIKEIT